MKKASGKAVVLLMFFVFAAQVICAEAKQDEAGPAHISLKTDTVTVYQQNALVERMGDVSLVKGENRFIIDGLPQEMIPDTLMAFRPENTQGYIIKEFEYKEVQSQVVLQGKEKETADRLSALKERLKAKQDSLEVLDDKIKFLTGISAKSTDELSKTLALKDIDVKNTSELLAFISGGIENCLAGKRELNADIVKINNEINELESELAGISADGTKPVKELYIDIESDGQAAVPLGVKYVVTGASWTPYYESNLEYAKSKIQTMMFARITQNTSEKWENVKLVISTGTPAFDATLPELRPWIIDKMQAYAYGNVSTAYAKRAVLSKIEAGGELDESKDVPEKAEAIDRVESVKYSEISMQIKIKDRYNVENTGEQKKVLIKDMEFKVNDMYYTVVPSYSKNAYLTASFKNTEDMVLMPGPVSLYLDDNYSGKAEINADIDRGEEVRFSYGTDENVKIDRVKLASKTGDSGIFGMDEKKDYAFKVTVKNYKDKAADIYIKEALPYSALDKIKVDFYEESIKHDKVDDKNIYTWKIKLMPGEQKELLYRFNIIFPKDMSVSGL